MTDPVATHLARNIKQLREVRGLTQDQLSRLSGVPRPTLANLETGESNPTLSVLVKVAGALQVSVESLISPPRATTKFYRVSSLPAKKRGEVQIRAVLPDPFGGLELDRMEFPPGARMVGMPHKSGTREYLACESGQIDLMVGGESWKLGPGDVVVFRGDQKHSYANPGRATAVGYSTILVGPTLV
jgi:XRE family transcriptional regulator, regulator of sulfur utilization